MKKNIVFLFVIIILAVVLRFWDLGSTPISPDWDEVALGYNAYSILQTGKDEYGKVFPIILQSFGDFKPALYSYLIIPFIPIFDLTVFTVRLPSAIMGVVAVLAVYILIKELFHRSKNENKKHTELLALLVSLLYAISPWHLQFSRVAFETNVGLTFNILMVLFFLKGLKSPTLLPLSGIFGSLSIYTYQSEKVFTPLLFLGLLLIYWQSLIKIPKNKLFIAFIIGLLFITPMVYETLTNKDALARARGVSIFADKTELLKKNSDRLLVDRERNDYLGLLLNNRRIVYGKTMLANYLSHFDPVWMFIKGDYGVQRHHAPNMGLEYLVFLPVLLIGIYQLFFGAYPWRAKALIIFWTLLAPVPASITTGVPHAVRTMNFLPTIQVYIALGLMTLWMSLHVFKYSLGRIQVKYLFFCITAALFLLNFFYYLSQYFVQQNYYHTKDWQYGFESTVDSVRQYVGTEKKIYVSNTGDMSQSHIFFLFYIKYLPEKYLSEGGTGKYLSEGKVAFENLVFQDLAQIKSYEPGAIVVAAGNQGGEGKVLKEIRYPDGEVAMRIIEK